MSLIGKLVAAVAILVMVFLALYFAPAEADTVPATCTTPGVPPAACKQWTLTLRDVPIAPVVIHPLRCYDCDAGTAPEGTLIINGNPLTVFPVKAANDKVWATDVYLTTPAAWWRSGVNTITQSFTSADRLFGEIDGLEVAVNFAVPPPSPPEVETPQWSVYWYMAAGGEPPACVALMGKYQPGSERRDEWKIMLPYAQCGLAKALAIRVINHWNNAYGLAVPEGIEFAPLTECDKMLLWARDEGSRAPEMTRARKLLQAGCAANLP